ncbi:LysR family transcriptional regulator [uncultured Tateyamaria sp.]|uniref:LysR family transcriptional regulator n=1 Tax=uncultured Tateyamaria sp. TaxID=455651 RepID=UPI002601E8B0|nr:LysR family transcriptional regulator [uncultured Tateyamaria sp.]
MNHTEFPSLKALRAFALVVEVGSLSAAARAMNVTQPAVTQQVRALEKHLGKKLLKRHGRGVLLTDDGQILAQYLQRGFDELRRGLDAVAANRHPANVRVTTSPSFAAFWLVPRVAAFQAAHPGITVQLDLSAEMRPIDSSDFDVAIRFCLQQDLPDGITPLLDVTLNVLCHSTIRPTAPVSGPDLTDLPWLQELGVSVVNDWFTRQGIADCVPAQISEMPGNLIVDAIRRAEAVAYTVCDWVSDDLSRGNIVAIWDKPERGCYYALADTRSPACAAFLQWLQEAVALGAH